MTNSNHSSSAQPIFRKQLPQGISAAVFENTYEDRSYRSINLQRSYRKDDSWKRMSLYIDHEQIPFVIEALKATWDFLNTSVSASEETA